MPSDTEVPRTPREAPGSGSGGTPMETPKAGIIGDTASRFDPKESAPLGNTTRPHRAMTTHAEASVARRHPETIGRYRVVRLLIGEGGMGIVYEAEQDQPASTGSAEGNQAGVFNPERCAVSSGRQMLGRLHHPGIAQVYEAGNADSGWDRNLISPWN